jgi:hypothetical protein
LYQTEFSRDLAFGQRGDVDGVTNGILIETISYADINVG